MSEEYAKLPPPKDSTLDDTFLTFENREVRRCELLRLPLSNQLTKEVLVHSGALREGGQPLKRGSKFEDMPPPARNIARFQFGLSRFGSTSLRSYEPYPEAMCLRR